jgi:hypothetical protein
MFMDESRGRIGGAAGYERGSGGDAAHQVHGDW